MIESLNICGQLKLIIRDNLREITSLRKKKEKKSDGSYVSQGDLLCERLVLDFINNLEEKFYLVSEETPDANLLNIKKNNVLILDPIDGTENFVSGLKEWGVAICYYKNGIHKQSMLALPELDEYIISGDKIDQYTSRIQGISSSLTKEDILKLPNGYEYRISGCCVYNMLNVIKGSFYSFENPKGAYIWDIIPGLNLALENNLDVTVNNKPYNGELLEPDQKYIFKIRQK